MEKNKKNPDVREEKIKEKQNDKIDNKLAPKTGVHSPRQPHNAGMIKGSGYKGNKGVDE